MFKDYTNKIKTQKETINTRQTSLRKATNEAIETMKETKSTLPRKEWITPEIVEMIEERRKYKNLNTDEYQEIMNFKKLDYKKIKSSKRKIPRRKMRGNRHFDENG